MNPETTTTLVTFVATLLSVLGYLMRMNSSLGGRIERLDIKIDATNLRIDTTNEKLATGLADVNRRLDTTNLRIDTGLAEVNRRIDTTNERIDTTNERIDSVSDEVRRVETRLVAEIRESSATSASQVVALEGRVTVVEAALDDRPRFRAAPTAD
jgi:hypothetical protein